MSVNIIVAAALDGAIGRGGTQPFFVSDDLRRFKALTMGHPIIMGRKTFEALPKGALPGRRNIVITSNAKFEAPGAERAASLEDAIQAALTTDSEVFIIGGGSVYRDALPLAHRIQLTRVYTTVPDADVFFPPINSDEWTAAEAEVLTDARSGLQYSFLTYHRAPGVTG